MKAKNIAIILAAGKSRRWGGNVPKQFDIIDGRKMYACSVETFNKHPQIDEVVIVVPDGYQDEVSRENNWCKVTKIVSGGDERFNSSMNVLQALGNEKDDTIVLFHDAARPYVSSEIIDRVLEMMKNYNAVTAAIPATDTIAQMNDDKNNIKDIPDRQFILQVQTPQGFKISTIREAYNSAKKDGNFTATDDCGVVLKYLNHEKIGIAQGDEKNFKYTFGVPNKLSDNLDVSAR
ncbi:MAG: 2-C-methyl-D-erythritol 4-phosphate cytidylyltransferase [Bacteroidales bacterium]|jgi:2-C-methyl-D-erythritol 4-phosphate cytidylyltransferase|nr:2-C-methyl-D-erythritol 4-phosphate cytidylyltransferase [Bacteroidales bacterium]